MMKTHLDRQVNFCQYQHVQGNSHQMTFILVGNLKYQYLPPSQILCSLLKGRNLIHSPYFVGQQSVVEL